MARLIGTYLDFAEPQHLLKLDEAAAAAGFDTVHVTDLGSAGTMLENAEVLFTCLPDAMNYCGSGLKWVCTSFAGINGFTGPEAEKMFEGKECVLSNSTGVYGETISEHIIMAVLMLCRKMPQYISDQHAHVWGEKIEMKSIRGSRITMLGAGDIAMTTAEKMRALGAASINAVSRSGAERKRGVFDSVNTAASLKELLTGTDILIMTMPGTDETAGMIGREQLALLPDDAIVVNIGRGSAIVLDDLLDALDSGTIAGAALDVFPQEPLPSDSRVWNTRNLIITPHTSGNMTLQYTRDKVIDQFCEDLERYSKGERLLREVDRVRGY